MADASRFPHLALPFAITGAAAGWLSAGIVQHPIVIYVGTEQRALVAGGAAALGGIAGWLIRRWCVRRPYEWEAFPPDPLERLPSDRWLRHAPVILGAGAITGAWAGAVEKDCDLLTGAACGVGFAALFLPVCAAVLSAARRAQRARLGSLVAGSDRRAVWGILAIALLVCSLGALLDWLAPHSLPIVAQAVALWLCIAPIACVLGVLAADALALRRARRAVGQGLTPLDLAEPAEDDEAVARTDLGIGDAVHARVARTGAVYRGRDRTLGLVQGDPELAFGALRRALRRGKIGLVLACVVCAAHAAASTSGPVAYYAEIRCDHGAGYACATAGEIERSGTLFEPVNQERVKRFYERGCDAGDGWSCMRLASYYRGSEGVDRDAALVAFFEYRAAQRGLCPDGERLVLGLENVCVDPLDPRR